MQRIWKFAIVIAVLGVLWVRISPYYYSPRCTGAISNNWHNYMIGTPQRFDRLFTIFLTYDYCVNAALRLDALDTDDWEAYQSVVPPEDRDRWYFEGACKTGALKIAKRLSDLRPKEEICTIDLFIETCKEGRLNVAQWLHEICEFPRDVITTPYSSPHRVLDYTIQEGLANPNANLTRWLFNTFQLTPEHAQSSFDETCELGYTETAQLLDLLSDGTVNTTKAQAVKLVNIAVGENWLEMTQYLVARFNLNSYDIRTLTLYPYTGWVESCYCRGRRALQWIVVSLDLPYRLTSNATVDRFEGHYLIRSHFPERYDECVTAANWLFLVTPPK